MKQMNLNLDDLNIKDFVAFTTAFKTTATNFDSQYKASLVMLSVLLDLSIDEVEELDCKDFNSYMAMIKEVSFDSVTNAEQVKSVVVDGEEYFVQFKENGEIQIKRNEFNYFRSKISYPFSIPFNELTKEQQTEYENLLYDKVHYIAAILFKKQGEKFDADVYEKRAELFNEKLSIKYLFPYIKLFYDYFNTNTLQ